MMMTESVRNRYQLPLQIDEFNFAGKKVSPLQELSDRIHDIREIKIAGRYFVQHRSEQKEIVAIDQRDLDVGIAGQSVVEVDRCMQPREAATEYQDSSFLLFTHKDSPPKHRDPDF
jgi:hypothetical protein